MRSDINKTSQSKGWPTLVRVSAVLSLKISVARLYEEEMLLSEGRVKGTVHILHSAH